MVERLVPIDIGILIAAVVMAVGAFCPIVHLPIVGSINYVMGGRGDGVYIVGCSAAIIGLVVFGYRRTSGIVGIGALFIIMRALVGFSAALSKSRAELAEDTGPFGGLSNLLANSVGLEWGWLLLVGGALAVTVMAMLPLGAVIPAVDGHRPQAHDDEERSFASADQKIAEYLENRKISPAIRNQSALQQPAFGKRHGF
jgi:hypothetical protein